MVLINQWRDLLTTTTTATRVTFDTATSYTGATPPSAATTTRSKLGPCFGYFGLLLFSVSAALTSA
jgi:hypothetical protein